MKNFRTEAVLKLRTVVIVTWIFIHHLCFSVVCYVEMSSGFNTSAINQTVAPEIHFPALGRPNKRHRRAPPGSSSKESNDETFKKPKNCSDPKPSNPAAIQKGNGSSPSELKSNYTETPHHNSSAPGNGSNSAHNPGMVPRGGSHPRHDRSHGSTNEQRGKGGKGGKGGRGTSESSEEESGEESSENILWTLYGLFQLPDRIACTSGATPSLNLCNVTCDSKCNIIQQIRERCSADHACKLCFISTLSRSLRSSSIVLKVIITALDMCAHYCILSPF